MVLQIVRWKENFQPTFEKLDTAVVWVQLRNLPVEYWEGEMLENIGAQFGSLIKVDEHTLNLSKAKFARMCVELDLTQPLKRGLWVGDGEGKAMVAVLYERLLIFCFSCGSIKHVAGSCTHPPCSSTMVCRANAVDPETSRTADEHDTQLDRARQAEIFEEKDGTKSAQDARLDAVRALDANFGPWLVVQRHRGQRCGRGPSVAPWHAKRLSQKDTWHSSEVASQHVATGHVSAPHGGGRGLKRGGRGG